MHEGLINRTLAAFQTAAAAYAFQLFADAVTMAFAYSEIFVGIALSVGPAVGGLLYSAGGFEVPFYTMGTIILLNIIPAALFYHPKEHGKSAVAISETIQPLNRVRNTNRR